MKITFTASQHATLFALLSRALLKHFGDECGEKLVRQAIRRYGEQRGHRMALRAQRDGEPLTMFSYMAYSEWRVRPGESEQEMLETVPDARALVTRCPWCQAWLESDLLRYGRLYCLEVDHALLRGFNPALQLDVLSTLSIDGRPCEFIYHGANLSPEKLNTLQEKKLANQKNGGVLPWEYHASHLYNAAKSILVAELGADGEVILQEVLNEFSQRYGIKAAQAILSYQAMDFDLLPEQLGDGL